MILKEIGVLAILTKRYSGLICLEWKIEILSFKWHFVRFSYEFKQWFICFKTL